MTDQNLLHASNDRVSAAEIRWSVPALPCLELRPLSDLLSLDHGELFTYTTELQDELAAVRGVLHETVGALAVAHTQRDRLRLRVRQLVDTVRDLRSD